MQEIDTDSSAGFVGTSARDELVNIIEKIEIRGIIRIKRPTDRHIILDP
jgi:hypothetical protein